MSGFDPTHGAHGQHLATAGSHGKGNTVHAPVPDTVVGGEGSAKRNIIRKGKKRGGGGGKKGIDIDDGSSYAEAGGALDEHDPNYDSEEETGNEYIPVSSPSRNGYADSPERALGGTKMTLTHYKKAIKPFIEQYFLSAVEEEIKKNLLDLNVPQYSYEFVKKLITMSMDHGDKERELASKLLSDFYPDVLSTNVIGKGFERLFEIIDELEKDAPNARDITATFIARCVVDEILPPSFLADVVVCSLGGDLIDHAKRMLSREHMGARLEHCWGPGDGRPVSEMKMDVDLIIQEYLLSRDLAEAAQCIKQLNSPHFCHEVVKRGITGSMDKTAEDRAAVSLLLAHMLKEDLCSPQQMQMGFQLVADRLVDLTLDIPAAKSFFAEYVALAKAGGLISADFAAPSV